DETERLKIGNDRIARDKAIEAAVFLRYVLVEPRPGVENVDQRQIVPLSALVVVEVVRRRDLPRAGADVRVGIVVGNDGNFAPDKRQHHLLTDQILVTLV